MQSSGNDSTNMGLIIVLVCCLVGIIVVVYIIVRGVKVNGKFKDLTSEDFPGVNQAKFDEWKHSVHMADKYSLWAFIVTIVVNVVSGQLFGVTAGNYSLVLLLLVFYLLRRRPDRLRKELRIDKAAIQQALRTK